MNWFRPLPLVGSMVCEVLLSLKISLPFGVHFSDGDELFHGLLHVLTVLETFELKVACSLFRNEQTRHIH